MSAPTWCHFHHAPDPCSACAASRTTTDASKKAREEMYAVVRKNRAAITARTTEPRKAKP